MEEKRMYNILKNHITHHPFDLLKVLERIKALYGRMEIDDAQRDELEALARERASFVDTLNTPEKLLELEKRIRALEEMHQGEDEAEIYPEYQAGKWYYSGDRCSYKGGNYLCAAPEGIVVVWSPEEHPAYWEPVA